MKTTIKWFGHSAFELTVGEQNLIFDPWLNKNPASKTKASDLDNVDLLAVSHGHGDHFGDTFEIMEKTKAKLICTTIISHYMNLHGYPKDSKRIISMSQGGTVLEGNMRISMVNAIHTTALFAKEWETDHEYSEDGGAVGYVVRTPDDHSIYFAGDTDVFMDMQIIEKRFHPEYAILPIGGRFTMDTESVMLALDMLKPKFLIPMHYNTHAGVAVDIDAFKISMKKIHPEISLLLPNIGETIVIEEK